MSVAEHSIISTSGGFSLWRLWSLSLAAAYLGALAWTYATIISPTWEYAGFTYKWPGGSIFGLAALAALLPSLLLPMTVRRVQDFSLWIVYFALYLPVTVLPPLMGNNSPQDSLSLAFALLVSFMIVCIPFARPRSANRSAVFSLSATQFWTVFAIVYVSLNIWVLVAFGSSLKIVSIQDIYSQRYVAQDVQQNSLVGYAIGILFGAFNPFLMALGLNERRYKIFAAGALGQVFLFATAAMKAVLLSGVIIPAVFFLVFRKLPYQVSRIGLVVMATAVGLALLGAGLTRSDNGLFAIVFAIVYIRTFCMVGVLMGFYTEFFLTHPLTYFSHIGVMQNFVRYPYSDPLGVVIGNFMIPGTDVMDANASYLATDGMAALGLPGIVLSGIFFRVFIWIFDRATTDKTLPIACCAFIPVLMSATNASIFTTLLTNGGASLALILYAYGRAIVPVIDAEAPAARLDALAGR